MSKIKFCGLSRPCDIKTANELQPEYVGFVFWPKSKRCITKEKAIELKALLVPSIQAVGVFLDAPLEEVTELLQQNIIDIAQLHGSEDEEYIRKVQWATGKPVIKAFTLKTEDDAAAANRSSADYVMLDSGAGTGKTFDWSLLSKVTRPYFLAGGLKPENAEEAASVLKPFALDVSSGIETQGLKDPEKMAAFAAAVRKETKQ